MSAAGESQLKLLGFVALAVLGIDAILLEIAVWRRFRGKTTFAPRWSAMDLWFVAQILAVAVTALMIPLVVLALMAGVSGSDLITLSSKKVILDLVLPSAILQNIPFFLVPAVWIVIKYRIPLASIGLPFRPRGRDWIAGIALGLIGMALSGAVGAGVEALADHFRSVPWIQAAIALDTNNPVASMEASLPKIGLFGAALAVFAVGICAPFGEEMLFRGFVFNVIKKRFGIGAGILISALLFTLPHSYGLGLAPVFVIGALMAWVYNNTGSLWVTIILHATNNTVETLFAFMLPPGHR